MRITLGIVAMLMALPACPSRSAGTQASPMTGPSGAAAPTAPERYETVVTALGRELRRAGEDCSAVARAMSAWTRAHSGELQALYAALDRWELEAGPYESRDFHKRLFPEIEARIDAGIRCERHPAAAAAYERFYEVSGFAD